MPSRGCASTVRRAHADGAAWTVAPPADPVACAVQVGQIATEIDETHEAPRHPNPAADSKRGEKARDAKLTVERRTEIAAACVGARWEGMILADLSVF